MGHAYWPLFDLEVRTPMMTLRGVDDALALELATLAGRGVHDPDFAPFAVPWTDHPSPALELGVLQFHWRSRGDTSPAHWRVPFAAIVDGAVVGSTDLAAADFPQLRQFETGSWLGREHQGRGLGKEMRIATLTVGFVALDAEYATTNAWHDNEPSLGVTRSLGYERQGVSRMLRRDRADTNVRFRMSREHFEREVRRGDIEIVGDEPVRDLLGISR